MMLPNVGEVTANLLYGEGFRSLEDIAFSDPKALMKAAGLKNEEDAQKIQTAARIALKNKLEKMTMPAQPEGQ